MRPKIVWPALIVGALLACQGPSTPPTGTGATVDRTVLPIAEPKYPPITELDARNAKAPPRFEVRAPDGAPNVVIVLIDDMGFGQSSTFGGPVNMPNLAQLAEGGLRYNNFHTTALCSPTRMALLTGRNHHSTNTGAIMELATAFPGNTGVRPQDITPLAEILRLNGYNTAAFGKYHETAPWEVSTAGPFDRWPTRSGFEEFYGFIGGETDQWTPELWHGTAKIEPPEDPNYYFTTDLANQATAWMRSQHAMAPDKPFFLYFATGATHAPHQVPREWIERYRGRFDSGWDSLRAQTYRRQLELGVIPPGTRLASKPAAIADWDTLPADARRLFARQMEVFAGFGEEADHEVGRLIQTIEELGELDNTLIFYIVGDNGASAEGSMNGLFNEFSIFNGMEELVEDVLPHLDELGGPLASNHYAAGWAVAGDAPFTWTKQVASNFGGTRNGMVISWPKHIKGGGGLRSQFGHVIDIAPTVLEAAGLPQPREVNGITQHPIEGISLLYSLADSAAPSRRTTQYFEMFGNRAIYHEGWFAGTIHSEPWAFKPRHPLAEDVWELYNVQEDFSLSHDLATENPAKLKELQDVFLREAKKYNVLPIDDRKVERFDAAVAGRPDLMGERTTLTLGEGMTGMMENAFINVKNRSHVITADVELPANGQGVIIAQGGRFGGWSLYMTGGRVLYQHNLVGRFRYAVSSAQRFPAGRTTIRYEFTYDGGGPGKGGTGAIFVNDRKVAEGRIDRTTPNTFAMEGADVGMDLGTPVSEDYTSHLSRFNGRIHGVTIELK
ncbi:MAG TPA: arylsulfatase [Gemmatimonadales bacterium]|nr:arylsulfatase [Gemmatimonadales bacterium]